MPGLFFYWALRERKSVHYEFLDNSVPRGETPRTVAFGSDGELIIQDIHGMCNVERFRYINIQASDASQVFTRHLSDSEAMAFVRNCCELLHRVDFVLPGSDEIYATAKNGSIVVNASLAPLDLVIETLGAVTLTSEPLGTLDANLRTDNIGLAPDMIRPLREDARRTKRERAPYSG